MPEMKRKAFKITRLKVSDIEDPELREKVQMAFMTVQGVRALEVEKRREANNAIQEANIATGQRGIAENRMLSLVGDAGGQFDAVRTEQVWFIFSKDGEIMLESPFTERDMRNAVRVQRANLEEQAERMDSQGDDLYEGGDEPEQ